MIYESLINSLIYNCFQAILKYDDVYLTQILQKFDIIQMEPSQSNKNVSQVLDQILDSITKKPDNQDSLVFSSLSDTQIINTNVSQPIDTSPVKDQSNNKVVTQQIPIISQSVEISNVQKHEEIDQKIVQQIAPLSELLVQTNQNKADDTQNQKQQQVLNNSPQKLEITEEKIQTNQIKQQTNILKITTNSIGVNTQPPVLTFSTQISTSIEPTIISKQPKMENKEQNKQIVSKQYVSNLSNQGLSQSIMFDSLQKQPIASKTLNLTEEKFNINLQSLEFSQDYEQSNQKLDQKQKKIEQKPLSLSPEMIAKSTTQRQLKQHYLREQILQPGLDPQQFIVFLNSKLSIDSDVDKCSLEQLERVVQQFRVKKKQQQLEIQNYYSNSSRQSQIVEPSIIRNSSIKLPSKIIIRSSPYQVIEQEFYSSMKCFKIEDKYENVKITCEVNNPQRKYMGGLLGIGGTSYLCFDVWVYGLSKQPVLRRYSDFIWLRNILLKFYPSEIIPPIPNKKASKRLPRQILKRMRILTFFLNDIVKMPNFLNNKYVEGFLKISELNKFQKLKQEGQKKKPFQSMISTQTLSGKVSLQLSTKTIKYKQGITKFVPQVQRLYKEITRNSKKMKAMTIQKINLLYSMADQFAQLFQISTKFYNYVKNQSTQKLSQIYAVLNNMMAQWGNTLKKQVDDVQKNMSTFFKYSREQFMGFKQLLQKIRLSEQNWIKQKDTLQKQKQKIFQLRDPKKWELNKKDFQNFPKSAIYDRSEAFKIMLPKQSVQVQNLKQNYAFYLSELSLHGNQNFFRCIERYCDNFRQFSIKMKVSNQQVGAVWNQISYKFSDPFQKKHAIRFMQSQKIGEDKQNSSGMYQD